VTASIDSLVQSADAKADLVKTRQRAYPAGWFRLLSSPALPPGAVKTVRAMGRDIVLFRTAQGLPGAVDPICPHLGAHLGHGGCVRGESLRCPFHGLRFGVDGTCVGSERPGPLPRLMIGHYPIVDWQGQVMAYLDPRRGAAPPGFTLPALSTTEHGPLCAKTLRLRGHVEDVAENGVDFGHFGTVHGYANVRDIAVRQDGVCLHSRFTFDRAHPLWSRLGTITGVFDTDIYGLGCSITRLSIAKLGLRARLFLFALQVEPTELDFTIAVQLALPSRAAKSAGMLRWFADFSTETAAMLLLPRIVSDALQDREIWAHRTALVRPRLLSGDAPLDLFRRWVRQFYALPAEDR
jgi:nitrite reductase/ring-hydroxylating ferredoxin subunit